ncbi:hypothetical protein ABK040_015147 [Willaertia magna]
MKKKGSSTPTTTQKASETSTKTALPSVFKGAIGIDFGNHNCTVSYFTTEQLGASSTTLQPIQCVSSQVIIIQNEDGAHHTPSVITINPNYHDEEEGENAKKEDEIIVGYHPTPGKNLAADQIVSDLKEFILEHDEKTTIQFNSKEYSQEDMLSILLGKMKSIAEHYLGKVVKKAVISCPIGSNPEVTKHCQNVIRKACEKINLEPLMILSEPLAALIGYGYDLPSTPSTPNESNTEEQKKDKLVCIVDVGALETNISIVKVNDKGLFKLLKSESKHPLGGETIDEALIQLCLTEFKKLYYKNMSENMFRSEVGKNRKVLSKLKHACENSKIVLSNNNQGMIEIDSLYEGLDLQFRITRARFEIAANQIFNQIIEHLKQTILSCQEKDSDVSLQNIKEIVLVGGSCQIPKLKEMIRNLFILNNNPEIKLVDHLVEDCIAIGCGIQAQLINNYKHLMK